MLDVSVVIPTYNCQQYIYQAIQSALGQAVSEVIVIDDGSTDDTQSIVKQLDCSRLRYIFQRNQGVSAARNYGIDSASGQLIAFLDADDYYLPGKIEQQVALFEATPERGLVHRSQRYSMVIKDGVVEHLNVDVPGPTCEISGGERILELI